MAEEKTVANLSEEKVEEVKAETNIMDTIVHDENAEVVTLRKLLEAGVHYGHQTKRWNPKMKSWSSLWPSNKKMESKNETIHLLWKKRYLHYRLKQI